MLSKHLIQINFELNLKLLNTLKALNDDDIYWFCKWL